jgi:hypothetical protein
LLGEEHLKNLAEVLRRFREHGIRLKLDKCHFLQDSVEYLGHKIDAQGLHTTDSKLQAIKEAPQLATVHIIITCWGVSLAPRLFPLVGEK